MDLAEKAYALSASLPATERFGLCAQIRRAAVSIPSNVAEGQRRSASVFRNHLGIALGSLAELETQLELGTRLGMLKPPVETWECLGRCQQLVYGLRRSLRRQASVP
jgi:four helix bundle protein